MHKHCSSCVISPINVVELGELSLHLLNVVHLGFPGGPERGVVQDGIRRLPANPGTDKRARPLPRFV